MKYSRSKLTRAYVNLLDTHSPSDLARGFAPLILKQRTARDMEIFSEEVASLYGRKHGIATATVTSARKLSKKAQERIATYIKHTEQMQHVNIISYTIDPALVGGAIIQTVTHTYTFSVAGKIQSIL